MVRNPRTDIMSEDARRAKRVLCGPFVTVKKPTSVLRFLTAGLCAMLFALCVPASAQQPAKIWRIGYLSSGNTATDSARTEGIRLALGERGYIEAQNIAIEYRYGEGKRDRFADLATEMVRLKVDLIIL